MIWFAETQGPMGFIGAFSGDRPFLSVIYILTTSLLSNNPLQWQILGLITRWLLGISACWLFREIWPKKKVEAFWLGILIVIFPGFKQQPISVVYSNGLFLLVSYFASYALMIMAMRKSGLKKTLFFIASLLTYAFCLFSTEYYIGLDILRGFVIWIAILNEAPAGFFKKLIQTLKIWSPYIILLFLFLIWRVFIFEFPTYQPELIESIPQNGLSAVAPLVFRMLRDPLTAGFQVWTSIIRFPDFTDFFTTSTLLYWILVATGTIIAFFLLRMLEKKNVQDSPAINQNTTEILILSTVGLFSAGFPFWVTGLPIELEYPYDRFLLAFMLGSCLLIIGLLKWLVSDRRKIAVILSLLVGFSIGENFQNANSYRREWMTHKDFFWQLSWRVPSLKENTILLTYGLPFQYYSDNSLTAPLNLLFAPSEETLDLPYYLALIDVRLGRSIPALQKGLEINQNFRNAKFTGNTSDALVFFYSPPGCLRIIDPTRDKSLPVLPKQYQNVLHLSDLDRVIPDPENVISPQASFFGQEPVHGWCYYFEKADLARQQEDWDQVVVWINRAIQEGLLPAEPSEFLIYLEGLFYTDQVEMASDLLDDFYFENAGLHPPICDMLSRAEKDNPAIRQNSAFKNMLEITDCLAR